MSTAESFRPIAPGAGAARYECVRLMISTIRLRKGSRYGGRKVWVGCPGNLTQIQYATQ